MTVVKWLDEDLYRRRMAQMQSEMDRILASAWPFATKGRGVYPPLNIYDDGEGFLVHAEIPGVDPKELDITATGDKLTLRGKRELETAGENASYHRRERRSGSFRRTFTLPEKVNSEKVSARSVNGILEIYLPRAEESKARKIEIAAS